MSNQDPTTLTLPTPVNVRVDRGDGTVVPLEMVYEGMDEDGNFVWINVTPLFVDRAKITKPPRLMAALLPDKVRLRLVYA